VNYLEGVVEYRFSSVSRRHARRNTDGGNTWEASAVRSPVTSQWQEASVLHHAFCWDTWRRWTQIMKLMAITWTRRWHDFEPHTCRQSLMSCAWDDLLVQSWQQQWGNWKTLSQGSGHTCLPSRCSKRPTLMWLNCLHGPLAHGSWFGLCLSDSTKVCVCVYTQALLFERAHAGSVDLIECKRHLCELELKFV